MKRVLFIGHTANRTGAPLVLLHLLSWLKQNAPEISRNLLLLRGGDLETEYRTTAETFVFPRIENPTLFRRGFELMKRKLSEKPELIIPKLSPFEREYDIVMGNTVLSMEYLAFFKAKGFRTICWLHELEYIVTSSFSREIFVELSRSVDRFIVGSRAVEKMLVEFGIETKTDVVYDFSTIDSAVQEEAGAVKRELGIPDSAFIVAGGGTVEWRKGVDLFLQAALCLAKTEADIYCVWIGGRPALAETDYAKVQYDLSRLDLAGRVVFTDVRNDYRRFLSAIDVFALTSREDPFPLICLEAAGFGKPVICFDKAGGMPEFVEDDAGAVVPYGDASAFCERALYFYNNRRELVRAGEAARAKLSSRFSMERSCQEIKQVLLDL